MIVDPDFLDHWRTRMLVDTLNDECAPQYIIRLWGHCQNRRAWVFDDMPVHATKAVCRYSGGADEFERAMIDCGFLCRDGDTLTVVGWDEHNAALIANWKNGTKGGRPKKTHPNKPKDNPSKTHGIPTDNPAGNPSITDKIGLDRIGLDGMVSTVISYLNDAAGKRFLNVEGNAKHVRARLKEGHTIEDMKKVVDKKTSEWKGTAQEKYLRPQTLFNSEKFDGYVNSLEVPNETCGGGFPATQQGNYNGDGWADGFDPLAGDFDDLT